MERKLAQIWGLWERGGSCSKFQTQFPVVDYMSIGKPAGFIWGSASREIKVLNNRQGANLSLFWINLSLFWGLPQWFSGNESACNVGDTVDSGSFPGSGRSPGEGMSTHSGSLA